jgi:small redox-active disulfide protein 2
MMIIKILGGGCAKCKVLYNHVNSAVRELGLEAEVVKVEDFKDISEYNVMSTPALVINEKVVALGVLKYKKVLEILKSV